jgi:hypothetical protein
MKAIEENLMFNMNACVVKNAVAVLYGGGSISKNVTSLDVVQRHLFANQFAVDGDRAPAQLSAHLQLLIAKYSLYADNYVGQDLHPMLRYIRELAEYSTF